jgi:hypothetical protein
VLLRNPATPPAALQKIDEKIDKKEAALQKKRNKQTVVAKVDEGKKEKEAREKRNKKAREEALKKLLDESEKRKREQQESAKKPPASRDVQVISLISDDEDEPAAPPAPKVTRILDVIDLVDDDEPMPTIVQPTPEQVKEVEKVIENEPRQFAEMTLDAAEMIVDRNRTSIEGLEKKLKKLQKRIQEIVSSSGKTISLDATKRLMELERKKGELEQKIARMTAFTDGIDEGLINVPAIQQGTKQILHHPASEVDDNLAAAVQPVAAPKKRKAPEPKSRKKEDNIDCKEHPEKCDKCEICDDAVEKELLKKLGIFKRACPDCVTLSKRIVKGLCVAILKTMGIDTKTDERQVRERISKVGDDDIKREFEISLEHQVRQRIEDLSRKYPGLDSDKKRTIEETMKNLLHGKVREIMTRNDKVIKQLVRESAALSPNNKKKK